MILVTSFLFDESDFSQLMNNRAVLVEFKNPT